jgi:hypothetical protein
MPSAGSIFAPAQRCQFHPNQPSCLRCASGGLPSVELALPIARHAIGRAGRRLAERVMVGGSQLGTLTVLVLVVVVEPVLTRLEAVDDRVMLRPRMLGGVLRGGLVAAADVAAMHASAQVEPPAVFGGEALDAAGPAGRDGGVDRGILGHAQGMMLHEIRAVITS